MKKKMGRPSVVAHHEQRSQIEYELANNIAIARISQRYGIPERNLYRYRAGMRPDLVAALRYRIPESVVDLEALKRSESESLMARLLACDGYLAHSLSLYMEAGDAGGILKVVGKMLSVTELKARLLGDIAVPDRAVTVNVFATPQGTRAMRALMVALKDHPAARAAVARELRQLDAPEIQVAVADVVE